MSVVIAVIRPQIDEAIGHCLHLRLSASVPIRVTAECVKVVVKELTDVLRVLDVMHITTRFEDGLPTKGNWPTPRIILTKGKKYSDALAPRGLPRNFYDSRWLDGLTEEQQIALNIQPSVDLKIAPSIQRSLSLSYCIHCAILICS